MDISRLEGQILGHQYHLHSVLGVGHTGVVYAALHQELNQIYAVKVLHPAYNQAAFAFRFRAELLPLTGLEHEHLITLHDFQHTEAITYIVMSYLKGGTLAQRLQQRHHYQQSLPSLSDVAHLLHQVAGALDYAHQKQIVHRDLKTTNIMFNESGKAVVVDLGMAALTATLRAVTGNDLSSGPLSYNAPEQLSAQPVTGAADQYSLGIIAYQMLTGRLPFEAQTPAALMEQHRHPLPALNTYQPYLPPALNGVVMRALASQPEERYPTVMDFAQAFRAAVQDQHEARTSFFTFPITVPIVSSAQTASSPVHIYGSAYSGIIETPPAGTPNAKPNAKPNAGSWQRVIAGTAVLVGIVIMMGVVIYQRIAESSIEPTRQAFAATDTGLSAFVDRPATNVFPSPPPTQQIRVTLPPTFTLVPSLTPTRDDSQIFFATAPAGEEQWNAIFDGQWSNPAGYIYRSAINLSVTSYSMVSGWIEWTLLESPRGDEQSKLGFTAIEYISGTFDPANGKVNFKGLNAFDLHQIISLDEYQLRLSSDGQSLNGWTKNHGDWLGFLSSARR